ncbi:MAG: hypothetical protein WAM74_21375 [Xanthobacteraceae bacterium]
MIEKSAIRQVQAGLQKRSCPKQTFDLGSADETRGIAKQSAGGENIGQNDIAPE